MVVPIIIGIGATLLAITARTTINTYRKYIHLTPEMIATLNNIKIDRPHRIDLNHPHALIHQLIREKYTNEGFQTKMTEQEALKIMGIEGDDILHLTSDMVKQKYRKLMVVNHPDKNGSQYMSQKINEAKDILDHSYLLRK